MIININTPEDFKTLTDYVTEKQYNQASVQLTSSDCIIQFEEPEQFKINLAGFPFSKRNEIHTWLKPFREYKTPELAPIIIPKEDFLIYGKDNTKNVVSIEAKDGALELFIEENGEVRTEVRQNTYWLLAAQQLKGFEKLKGNLHYKYIKYYHNKQNLYLDKQKYRSVDTYTIANEKESAMVLQGITYFKGMKVDDVSRFHFDLETIGLLEAPRHKTLLISTTFIKAGQTQKKLFALDEFNNDEGAMISSFCEYVRTCNPSIISGFNIYGFDLPYLQLCADNNNISLDLGRDRSPLKISKYTSKFRKDGSQDYDYKRCHIYGREIVDMMFVAYHFDFARKYERYALKSIIKQEGLEKLGRTFYESGQIGTNWDNPVEREKIKKYCMDDAEDSESLYKLMIAAYFYLTPHIPKSFEAINYSATGSQINSFLVRSYLQEGHSVPKADEIQQFPGAISAGYPGIYKNVFKVDVASLYPSIMLQYNISDVVKDPKGHFIKMVQYFTNERLSNKKKAKDTGDRYYEELEQAQKIVINSAYGLLGATGLNFNYPVGAAKVTEYGREVLKTAIKWATGQEYIEKEEVEDGNV